MYKSVDVKTHLPEPHDLFGVPLVMPVNRVPLPVIHIHFLHTTQHQLLKKKITVVNYISDFSLGLHALHSNHISNIFVTLYFYNLHPKYLLHQRQIDNQWCKTVR